MRRTALLLLEAGALLSIFPTPCFAQKVPADLTQVSLEDLMHIQVTSVSKKEQTLSKVAAAIFVITPDDIRHSGATNIPDLLRMVPGVIVQRIQATTWTVSIRGFADIYSDKVLVLVDGRSVYRPGFSGVLWDEQDIPLENIERIEVIRGPGGTVWGANAVNGVINITTRRAWDTQGGLIAAGGGSETTADGLVQYGGKIRSNGAYRVFSRYFNIETSLLPSGAPAADGWHGFHQGFRSDWDLSPTDTLTLEGDVLRTRGGQTFADVVSADTLPLSADRNDRLTFHAANILGRWNHTLRNGSLMSLQVYDDYYSRHVEGSDESRNTVDVDFQHHVSVHPRHDLVWGLGYRMTSDYFLGGYAATILPPHRRDHLYSTFVQDEMRLTGSLSFILGSKFEHNPYTGFEYEPSAQLVWQPSRRQTLWASAARAIRQPSRKDYGMTLQFSVFPVGENGFGVNELRGQTNIKNEELRDFELGYRVQVRKALSLDAVGFWSFYRHLVAMEPQPPVWTTSPQPAHLVVPLALDNKAHAFNYGAEIDARWDVHSRWRLRSGLSLLQMNVSLDPDSHGVAVTNPGRVPGWQFQIHSWLDLTHRVEWDTSLAVVAASQLNPGYQRVDTRLGWRFGESTEISVTGQNLLTPRYAEHPDDWLRHTLIERAVFGKITWRF